MARDENDRHEALNPDLSGDVLSPRWSTDDTDEQPAIQVSGNETYIMPADKSTPMEISDYLAQTGSSYGDSGDALAGDALAADPLGDRLGSGDALAAPGDHLSAADPLGPVDPLGSADPLGTGDALGSGGAFGDPLRDEPFTGAAGASGPHDLTSSADEESDSGYLPIDRGYESEDAEPKRGFLGSGWSDDGDGEQGDHEVRRRTKILLVAAAAVVVLGAGAGWMLTSSSGDDPCAGGHCASVGQATAPVETPKPKDSKPESQPTDSDSPEPTATETAAPTHTPVRVRSTRTPSPRTSPTRIGVPTTKPSTRGTKQPEGDVKTTTTDQQDQQVSTKQSSSPTTAPPAPTTQAPAPQPAETKKGGLLGFLFPWA
ncbi:hypothetical protein ACIBHX_03475 [Nonomuraea sp. NPDC050536]|uniref:hypothetical protein n=1 Tax=Nonomuraea sp. NPDC050536 TaxID=3364366 RepID=UPI0037C9C708